MGDNRDTLEQLYDIIVSRKGGDPAVSHTAKLFAKGRAKIAQKMGEEAVELAIAAVSETREAMVSESADLVFHLRSEEHTSELQSLMRISYAVFCLKKKHHYNNTHPRTERNKTTT